MIISSRSKKRLDISSQLGEEEPSEVRLHDVASQHRERREARKCKRVARKTIGCRSHPTTPQ